MDLQASAIVRHTQQFCREKDKIILWCGGAYMYCEIIPLTCVYLYCAGNFGASNYSTEKFGKHERWKWKIWWKWKYLTVWWWFDGTAFKGYGKHINNKSLKFTIMYNVICIDIYLSLLFHVSIMHIYIYMYISLYQVFCAMLWIMRRNECPPPVCSIPLTRK